MSDDPGNPPFFGGNPGEPVPKVDPQDLKTLWQKQQELQARHPGEQVAMGMGLAEQICKPGADIPALGYRATILWLLSQIERERFAAFTKDGQPIDAAFRAAAKVPVEWMGEGITRQAPFDVGEFCGCAAEHNPPTRGNPHRFLITAISLKTPGAGILSAIAI